jgi:DNA-binding GntR family transcriptional regulator
MALVRENDPRPPYTQIADALRQQIDAGELKPGDRLRSGRDLAREYGVAPMTVQSAVSVLRDEGRLVSWQGRGVFVADPQPATDNARPRDLAYRELTKRLDAIAAELDDVKARLAGLERTRRDR